MASVRRRPDNEIWMLDYMDASGARRRKSLGRGITAEQAREIEAEYNQKERNKRFGLKTVDVTYAQLKSEYLTFAQQHRQQRQLDRILSAIRRLELYATPSTACDITPRLLQDVQAGARKDAGSRQEGACGRNRDLRQLVTMMRWAEENPEWEISPQKWGQVRPEPEPGGKDEDLLWYSESQLIAHAEVAYGRWQSARLLGLYLGLRPGENYHARFSNINWDQRLYRVTDCKCDCAGCYRNYRGHWRPKADSHRWLPIPSVLFDYLKDLGKTAKTEWILAADGERPTEASSQAYMSKLASKAGLGGTMYTLRHTYASHWVLNKGDMYMLSKRLGHEDIETTQKHYAHLNSAVTNRVSSLGQQILHPELTPLEIERALALSDSKVRVLERHV